MYPSAEEKVATMRNGDENEESFIQSLEQVKSCFVDHVQAVCATSKMPASKLKLDLLTRFFGFGISI